MKKIKIIILLFILVLVNSPLTRGQNKTEKTDNDTISSTIVSKATEHDKAIFYKTRPSFPYTPDVSRYIMKGKNNIFLFSVGGYVNPIIGWDIGSVMDNTSFIPSRIPVPAAIGNKSEFIANPMHSALSLHLVGLPETRNELAAYIKFEYDGEDGNVRAKNVFISYKGILIGKNSSIFSDGEAVPQSIDPQGPNGIVSATTYQLSYKWRSQLHWELGIGMELPTFDKYPGPYWDKDYPEFNGTQFYFSASQSVPDFPVYAEYKSTKGSKIRLSGIIRNFFYGDSLLMKTRSTVGWGVQLSGKIKAGSQVQFYYNANYGKGIGHYIQDLSDLPLSYIPSSIEPGKMKPAPMASWMAAVNYRPTHKFSFNYIYSQARVWDNGVYYPDYRYGVYMNINMFYALREYLVWGIEGVWGLHKTFGLGSADMSRIQTALKFSF